MPRTRSLAWSQLKVGVLAIVAVVIASVLIFSLTGTRGFFWQRYSLKTRFQNVAGLAPGSPVRVAGVEVGSVTDVAFAGDEVEVTFHVNRAHGSRITGGSVARLGSVSLLGESAVDITPSGAGTPIPEWGYVPAGKTTAALADVTEQASQGITELTALLQDARRGRGTVGKLMTEEALYEDLRRFVASAGSLTESLKEGRGTIGRLVNDPAAANALEASLKNIEGLTRQLSSGEGSLGKLLNDDSFSRSLTAVTTQLETFVARMNGGEGTIGKLATDPALFNRLSSVTERLDGLTARLNELVGRLNEGEGTAGRLLKDGQLYENMNKATSELAALIAEITKNPRKYLNVKVSIF